MTSTGICRLGVDEIAELVLAFLIAAGDPHDIAVVFGAQVRVLVDQRLPHAGGVLLVDTENDRLLVSGRRFPSGIR